jgi:hypothetical protein
MRVRDMIWIPLTKHDVKEDDSLTQNDSFRIPLMTIKCDLNMKDRTSCVRCSYGMPKNFVKKEWWLSWPCTKR